MSWPTVSKGVFYPGYASGMKESPAPSERDMEIPATKGANSGVTITRVLQGGNTLNELVMRKPFG